MVLSFALAAYAIVANDSIQTLGTFLSSNMKRPWWLLWIWISGIMVVTVTWGWMSNGGDPAFGRLGAEGKNIPFPHSYGGVFTWLFVLPPLALVLLTRAGIPVSTSLLVLTAFKGLVAAQQGESLKGAVDLFGSMMEKSLTGYGLALITGFLVVLCITGLMEKRFFNEPKEIRDNPHRGWMVFQWLSTGFLWSMWLVQDLANIFAYLPRQLHVGGLIASLLGMILLQGYLFRKKGGKIQQVVLTKTNTLDVRSATLIDLLYGLILLTFKVDYIPKIFKAMGQEVPWPEKMPMSTTWVFLGLLAGREIALSMKIKHKTRNAVGRLIFIDAGKAFLGSVVAILLALTLPLFITAVVVEEQAEVSSEVQGGEDSQTAQEPEAAGQPDAEEPSPQED